MHTIGGKIPSASRVRQIAQHKQSARKKEEEYIYSTGSSGFQMVSQGASGSRETPWVKSVQLDERTMAAIIEGVAAKIKSLQAESSRAGMKG